VPVLVAAVLMVAGCGLTAAPSTQVAQRSAPADGYAQRAAAQLETKVLPQEGDPDEIWGHVLDLPLPAPDFQLTSTDGSAFDFARDADAPVTLLYFGYTSCPDVCPTHMAALGRALDELTPGQRDQVDVLFVSVDPTVDTPEHLRSYLDGFGPGITGLTGTTDAVNDALASIALPQTAVGADADEPPKHPSSVLGYTADGRAHVVWPFGTTPDTYAHDLRMLIDEGWSETT
jgi:protein SCO1/2